MSNISGVIFCIWTGSHFLNTMDIRIYEITQIWINECRLPQVLVPGNINNAFLDQLVPDTPYSVDVIALYADGQGAMVKGDGKTCEALGEDGDTL